MRAGLLALSIATVALACSVDPPGSGFSSGLTFGEPDDSGPATTAVTTNGDGETESLPTGGDSDQGSGNLDGDTSADDTSDDDTSDDDTSDDDSCMPSDELCDGMDNDCDGEIDNDTPEAGAPCETGMVGLCAAGTTACENGAVVCIPDSAATDEVCNGIDDNCNGPIDDNNPGGGEDCDTGMPGVCAGGLTECTEGALVCAPQFFAIPEQCDNLDNDCNGQVDDGNPEGGAACNTGGLGICGVGTQQCVGGSLSCQQNQMAEPDEICGNNLDDDCNGQVDEDCCAHDVCDIGGPLMSGCDPCVTTICNLIDSFCCTDQWDAFCVANAVLVCGASC
ncbi:MAG: MopE-related protein [Myxococcota bacterium]